VIGDEAGLMVNYASANLADVFGVAAAEELTASIHEISWQVARSAQITGKAVADAHRTHAIVRARAEGARKIGKVAHLVTSIATQINLLTLNATIEGARAGTAAREDMQASIHRQMPGRRRAPTRC
jgi:methyl-accepting chemotaxis protein